jgi:DNA invertase Pin-like site-specific DNA recombinase
MQSAKGTGRGCAIYVSGGQNGSTAITKQLDRCRAIAECNGWAVEDDLIFVDRNRSSKSRGLPGLTRLMGAATNRRMDRVIIEHPGRLCRGVKGIRFLLQTFARHGIHIYFADWRTEKTDANKLLYHAEAMVAFAELTTDTHCSIRANVTSWLA